MTIDFVKEDGTGLSTATTYADIDDLKSYWFNQGYDFDSLSDNEMKRLLNKSTAYIDSNYDFPGYRATSTQSLEWVRESAYYLDGYDIDNDVVPSEVLKAVCEMAYLLNAGNDPNAIIEKEGKVVAESVKVDVISESKKYEEGSVMYTDIYPSVDNLLYRLTGGVSNNFKLSIIRTGGESP